MEATRGVWSGNRGVCLVQGESSVQEYRGGRTFSLLMQYNPFSEHAKISQELFDRVAEPKEIVQGESAEIGMNQAVEMSEFILSENINRELCTYFERLRKRGDTFHDGIAKDIDSLVENFDVIGYLLSYLKNCQDGYAKRILAHYFLDRKQKNSSILAWIVSLDMDNQITCLILKYFFDYKKFDYIVKFLKDLKDEVAIKKWECVAFAVDFLRKNMKYRELKQVLEDSNSEFVKAVAFEVYISGNYDRTFVNEFKDKGIFKNWIEYMESFKYENNQLTEEEYVQFLFDYGMIKQIHRLNFIPEIGQLSRDNAKYKIHKMKKIITKINNYATIYSDNRTDSLRYSGEVDGTLLSLLKKLHMAGLVAYLLELYIVCVRKQDKEKAKEYLEKDENVIEKIKNIAIYHSMFGYRMYALMYLVEGGHKGVISEVCKATESTVVESIILNMI